MEKASCSADMYDLFTIEALAARVACAQPTETVPGRERYLVAKLEMALGCPAN
jgi:hypothetical protein